MVKIIVKFKEYGEQKTLAFHSYQAWGKWIADNYEYVEIIDVIQEEE